MPNIAVALKEEIARVARKELKGDTASLQKSIARYRSEIAALKRRMAALESAAKRLGKGVDRKPKVEEEGRAEEQVRFSAKGLATRRARLGLSAADMGLLVGVSGQSIYKWEDGKARPRAKQIEALVRVRKYGKREVIAQLEMLKATA